MESSLVSIIIPSYNCSIYLPETLDSVRNQVYTNWECIIVDDGSTDHTREVALNYCSGDVRFRYFFQENRGQAAARNFGISESNGYFILPLDADDKIESNYINEAVEILQNNPSVKIVYCEVQFFGARNDKWNLPVFNMREFLIDNIIFCTALFRKKDFLETKGYDSNIVKGFEDWDLWISMLEKGGEVYRIPGIRFYYRIRKNSTSYQWSREKLKQIRIQLMQKHAEIYSKYFDDNLIDVLFELKTQNNKIRDLENSYEYKIGKLLLTPLRRLKSFFSRRT